MRKISIFCLSIFSFFASTGAIVDTSCVYSGKVGSYLCTISRFFIDSNEPVSIGGAHLAGFNDASVTHLKFVEALMIQIPPEFCQKFRNLKSIDAQSVRLEKLDLKFCNNLEVLDVSTNKITNLIPFPTPSLQIIDVSYNEITNLEPRFLLPYRNLTSLNIRNNKIKELKAGALLTNSTKTVGLEFSYNPLQRIEGTFEKNAVLGGVGFNYCNIPSVDPKFLYGFTGRITYLGFYANKCISKEYNGVNTATAFTVRTDLQKCFDSFTPSTESPVTSTPATTITTPQIPATPSIPATPTTPKPSICTGTVPTTVAPSESPVPIGEMYCRMDASKKFYNCESKTKLIVIDSP